MIKSISSPTVQTIFRAGGFRIYVVSTTLYIEYNGVYYTIPITLGKWGFFTIRQGEVDVYNYNITEPIESNKRILHISSSFINDEFSPITYTENTTSGGPDFVGNLPSIYDKTSLLTFGIENIQADFVFARNLLNLTEKDALFSSEITGNKFYLLENFVGTVVEFRIWDKLVDDYKKRVIERGSYIFSGEGDLSQNIVNIKARIENIREVDSSKEGVDFNGEKSSFMHAQSVSTLSTHNEFLKGELFSIETKNSSFPTQETNLDIALTTL
jgi:hypothetical protein